jgi:hypothetical protein
MTRRPSPFDPRTALALALVLASFALAGFAAAATAPPDRVVLYQQALFRGTNRVLPGNWPGGGAFDRRVRSIRVPAGTEVTLYSEPNYKGTSAVITRDWSTEPTAWWGSRVRSIRVRKTGGPIGGGTSAGDLPSIYAGPNFSGPSRRFEENWPGESAWDGAPHRVVSLKVPPGWRVQGFSERDYRGESITFVQDWTPDRGDRWYGRLRSFAVVGRPDRPTGGTYPAPEIFARAGFAGASKRIEDDWPGEASWSGLPNRVTSIRVPAGWRLRAFDEDEYRGEWFELDGDWSPRDGDRWWGRVRSLRVLERGPWVDPSALPVVDAERWFNGESLPLPRDWAGAADWNGGGHTVSSIRVPQGWQLVLFTNPGFTGAATLVGTDWQASPDPKERVRSIRVYRPGETPVVPR